MIEHKLIISGIFTYSGFSLFLFLFLFSRKKFFFYFYFLFFFIIFIKQLLLSSSISVVVLVLIHVLLIQNLNLVSPISCNIAEYIWHLNRVIYLNSPARLVTSRLIAWLHFCNHICVVIYLLKIVTMATTSSKYNFDIFVLSAISNVSSVKFFQISQSCGHSFEKYFNAK